jgi:hypothetical protein
VPTELSVVDVVWRVGALGVELGVAAPLEILTGVAAVPRPRSASLSLPLRWYHLDSFSLLLALVGVDA